jgi:plasmid stabilization system protein ParE
MPRPVKLLGDAIVEASAAFLWYRTHSDMAAGRFRDEFNRAMDAIGSSPEAWPPYVHETRRYLFRRFPFFVVYRVTPDEIQVVAVAHARRRPGYWKDR